MGAPFLFYFGFVFWNFEIWYFVFGLGIATFGMASAYEEGIEVTINLCSVVFFLSFLSYLFCFISGNWRTYFSHFCFVFFLLSFI